MNCENCGKRATLREDCPNGRFFCGVLCQASLKGRASLRVRVVTWNMGDNKKSHYEWAGELRSQWEVLTKEQDFDILFVTVQEAQASDTFGKALAGQLKKNYDMFKTSSKTLAPVKFYVHSYAFFHRTLYVQSEDISRKTTCLKTVCTKSSTGLAVDMDGIEFVFVGSHLPVNPKDKQTLGYNERVAAARKTLENVYYPLIANKERTVSFWAGDFNFRMNQLEQAREQGQLDQFQEQKITFPPTCKMKRGGDSCDRPTSDTTNIPGCYDMKRVPSHCDRILYDSRKVQVIPQTYNAYGDAPAIQESDHNLVYADFFIYLK